MCNTLLVCASDDFSQIIERIRIAEAKGDFHYCMKVADGVYNSNSTKIFSNDELYILAAGARGYCFVKDTIHAEKLGRYPVAAFLQEYDTNVESRFILLTEIEKKEFIKQFSSAFHRINKILLYIEPQKAVRLFEYHHKLITENKQLFVLNTNEEDLMDFLICVMQDQNWIHAHHQVNLIFETYYPIIQQYIKSKEASVVGLKSILPFMETYLPYVLDYSLSNNKYTQYANQITNYVLTYNELVLWAKGASALKYQNDYVDLDIPIQSKEELFKTIHNDLQSFDKRCTDWKIIKDYLQNDESAVLLASFIDPYNNAPKDFAIAFHALSDSPKQILLGTSQTGRETTKTEFNYNDNSKSKIYVCYIDGSEGKQDLDMIDKDVYRKFSLFDLIRENHENVKIKYGDGTIFLCADINYGTGTGNAQPLNEGRRLINMVKESFSSNAYVLSGNSVRKINFFNLVDDVQILHISTHGMSDQEYLINENSNYTQNAFENVGNETYLCLSNYNANPQLNRMTATEIQEKITLHNNCLVFLDACNTNNLRKTYYGSNSLAKAFYIAGARHIIAYLNPINEKVATDFAISFYRKIADNPNMTYHQVFYQTKKEIFNQYRDSGLITNQFGGPSLDVVLWE